MKALAKDSSDAQCKTTAQKVPQQQDRSDIETQFIDNRVEPANPRYLQGIIDNSPRTHDLAQLNAMMNNSPRRVAQRHQHNQVS